MKPFPENFVLYKFYDFYFCIFILNRSKTILIRYSIVLSELRTDIEGEIIPARASSGKTRNGDETNFAAAHAIDKDLRTLAAIDTLNGECWLKLELESSTFIDKILIYSRFYNNYFDTTSGCVTSVNNFNSCIDNINNVDVSVYEGEVMQKSCGTLQLTYGLDLADQIYTIICKAEGDVVKFSKTTKTIVVLEIILFGGRDDVIDIGMRMSVITNCQCDIIARNG